MSHTPGPWEVEVNHDETGDTFAVRMGDALEHSSSYTSHHVITIYESADPENFHEQYAEIEANARLISAAPDLLEALKWAERKIRVLVTEDDGTGAFIRGTGVEIAGFGAGVERIRAAIAKAEGRELGF